MALSPPPLGIMMLETNFHRPAGDVGHPSTWPFPVLFATVPGATPRRVVDGDTEGLLQPFVDARRQNWSAKAPPP
jgi:hypothetical protein